MQKDKGFIGIVILLILLAGIIGGVYLVQKTQIFSPKAASNQVIDINRDGKINALDYLLNRINTLPPPPTVPLPSDEQTLCAADVQECSDGSFVERDPSNNCSFQQCPQPENSSFQFIPKGAPANYLYNQ